MSLSYFQDKIKEKRKKTPFRDFLMEFISWESFNFYKNNGLISSYPPSERIKNLVPAGKVKKNSFPQEIQKDTPFLKQFSEFFRDIEQETVIHHTPSENCEYASNIFFAKDSYLSYTLIRDVSNVFYSFSVKENSHNVFNSSLIWNNSENVYSSFGIIESFNIFYSKYCINSNNIWFSSNLIGCSECLFCDGLENKKYCIENKEYSKEEYKKKKEEIFSRKEDFLKYFKEIKAKGKNQGENIKHSYFVRESENVENGFMCYRIKNGRNILFLGGENQNENMYDFCDGGTVGNSDIYGTTGAGGGSQNIYLSKGITRSSNIYYSYNLDACSFCLGCINLQNQSYCIFNKQYEKEEWHKKVEEIFSSMEKDGTLGDYFPASMNPYYFNDSLAFMMMDFSKEEVINAGFMWRDEEIKVDIPEEAEIVYSCHSVPTSGSESGENKNLNQEKDPDSPVFGRTGGQKLDDYQGFDANGNWYINPDIMKKVIVDEKGNYYKIVKPEYDFLIKYALPLPEIHWFERLKMGLTI